MAAISQEIHKEIVSFSAKNDQKGLLLFLVNQLEPKNISVDDILQYVKEQRYKSDISTINIDMIDTLFTALKKNEATISDIKDYNVYLARKAISQITDLIEDLLQDKSLYLLEPHQKTRLYEVEERFFNLRNLQKEKHDRVIELLNEIIRHRFSIYTQYNEKDNEKYIELDGKSSRLLITAEKLFQKATIAQGELGKKFRHLQIPTVSSISWSTSVPGYNHFASSENYKIGDTQVITAHRTNPKQYRPGTNIVKSSDGQLLDSYNSIYEFLCKLADIQPGQEDGGTGGKQREIAKLIIEYGKNQRSVNLDELKKIYDKAALSDVHKFNEICFLIIVKEQTQWPHGSGNIVAQARCLIMMEAGCISLSEAFGTGSLFGIYSGYEISLGDLTRACDAINDLYTLYLKNSKDKDLTNIVKEYLKNKDPRLKQNISNSTASASFFKPSSAYVLSREQAHQDLRYVYSTDSDSDHEKYPSDLDENNSSNFTL